MDYWTKNENVKQLIFINVKKSRRWEISGAFISNGLSWTVNSEKIVKKAEQRTFFLPEVEFVLRSPGHPSYFLSRNRRK